jgi:diadenosine tetraphosphate (Ap4A) HIT family hydrolase
MVYQFLGEKFQVECLGCSQANKEIIPPSGLIYESDNFILHQNPKIPIKGFLIISSKKYCKSLMEFSDKQKLELINIINLGIRLLKDNNIVDEITIIQEENSKHFHIWLFPCHAWMYKKFKNDISQIKKIWAYAEKNTSIEERKEIVKLVKYLKNCITKR